MKGLLEHIESLKREFAKLQPLSAENQQRLHKKFRLEWNYNSNHIEGNTLTYGETELLLIFEKGKGQHDVREFDEMRGHDVALRLITDLSTDKDRRLTEKFIREINEVILVRPFYKEAITPDGQATRRLIKIGDYKSFPNSVRLQNGEIFNYPSPSETPALMHDFITWYFSAAADENINPIMLAAELHYRFVCIHPFDDGNGRISRLLMNYHLLKNGYPPVIIKSSDKKNYLFALQEADTGNVEAFKNYIAEQLIWSYEISIKAAKGESIDEMGDWEKKALMLEKSFNLNKTIEKRKSHEVVLDCLNNVAVPLIEFLLTKYKILNSWFFDNSVSIQLNGFGILEKTKNISACQKYFEHVIKESKSIPRSLDITYNLINFKNNGTHAFNLDYTILFNFLDFSYLLDIVDVDEQQSSIEKYYHQNLGANDIDKLANHLTELIIRDIEKRVKN